MSGGMLWTWIDVETRLKLIDLPLYVCSMSRKDSTCTSTYSSAAASADLNMLLAATGSWRFQCRFPRDGSDDMEWFTRNEHELLFQPNYEDLHDLA